MLRVATTILHFVSSANKPNKRFDRWGRLLRPDKGDPTPDLFVPRDDFTFIVVTGKDEELPKEALARMAVIRVGDSEQQQADGDKDAHVDQELAGLFGAAEVKRISLAMVEAAFDGCAPTICHQQFSMCFCFHLWRPSNKSTAIVRHSKECHPPPPFQAQKKEGGILSFSHYHEP